MDRLQAADLLAAAMERRSALAADLASDAAAYRLVNADADGFDGLTVDRYGPALLVSEHRREVTAGLLIATLCDRFESATPIFHKRAWSRDDGERSGKQVAGEPVDSELVVDEKGLRFSVHLARGEHTGIFLDSRPARQAVRRLAEGRRVLNLFSYTGAFGVAAAAGGARSTTNVDNKKSALEGARRNYALNGLASDTRAFLDSDAIRFLNRARRGRGRYDLVIVDPPPRFRRPGGRRFSVHDGYGRLIGRALRVLDPGGVLLAGLNALGVDDRTFEGHLAAASEEAGRSLEVLERIGAGSDFPATRNRPAARFALCTVDG